LGFATPTQMSNRYYLSNKQKPNKILDKRERGRIQGLPIYGIFSGTPCYLRNGKSYRFQIWPVHSEGPSEQKPTEIFREKGAWAYPGTAHFLNTPYYLRTD